MTGVVNFYFPCNYFHSIIMEKKTVSRKKFIVWGAGFSAMLAIPSVFLFRKKKQSAAAEPKIVKMLGQDGKLVEVDLSKVSRQGQITDKEIHTWVKSKPNQF
jgi:hypothetical protein